MRKCALSRENSSDGLVDAKFPIDIIYEIRLIDFKTFESFSSFPRYPEKADCVRSFDSIDRENTFIVFISHCWLRGHPAAEGWEGRPHPDSINHDKFRLCVKSIRRLWKELASRFDECMVWLDFGCVNQDGNPAAEIYYLDKLIEMCDCLITPLYDTSCKWTAQSFTSNWYFPSFESALWNTGPYAYLNRGWCRIEMFFAANIPLLPNSETRLSKFEAGLRHHISQNRRPHILICNQYENRSHFFLPPLQNSYFDVFHPSKGHLSNAADRVIIDGLVESLKPYMEYSSQVYYTGERNDKEEYHGQGYLKYENGDVYEGNFVEGSPHGQGKMSYFNGDAYEGAWIAGKYHGFGLFLRANGNRYEGYWEEGLRHGIEQDNVFTWADGRRYTGGYLRDKRHGDDCIFDYGPEGNLYRGAFRDDTQNGFGVMTYANGDVYEGEWKIKKRHGLGTITYGTVITDNIGITDVTAATTTSTDSLIDSTAETSTSTTTNSVAAENRDATEGESAPPVPKRQKKVVRAHWVDGSIAEIIETFFIDV